jgi:hypothetical protein
LSASTTSDVVVEVELVRVRAQGDLLRLTTALVVDPGVDHVLGEHPALQQKLVVSLQGVQHLVQAAGGVLDLVRLLRLQGAGQPSLPSNA